jgi:hypothetical protein
MRVLSTVKSARGTRSDPYRVVPIPPQSVVRLSATSYARRHWPEKIGSVFRIGYYGRTDGLDCIWLVDDQGEYAETIDHAFLFRWYDIITVSAERNLYGARKPKLLPVRFAEGLGRARTKKRKTGTADRNM